VPVGGPRLERHPARARPEVQLLYKSHPLLSKDDADFRNVVGSLERHGRDWLRAALFLVAPGHAWLAEL